MDPLNATVTVSNIFDLSSSTVRGLWFKHDFYSDYCPTYTPQHEMKYIDLGKSLNSEWAIRKSMIDEHLREMITVREIYDMKMEEKRLKEEHEQKSKGRNNKTETPQSKTRRKVAKEAVEPPIVDESTYVDVEDEFVKMEDAQAAAWRESLSEENLALGEHEVS